MNIINKWIFIITMTAATILPANIYAQINRSKEQIKNEITITHKDILKKYVFTVLKECKFNKEEAIKLIRKHMIIEINSIRKANNLPILQEDPNLQKIAQDHAEDMLNKSYYSHMDRNHQNPSQRAKNAWIEIYNLLENIDKWSLSINQAINEMWMLSNEHKNNILSPNITHIWAWINFWKDTNISEIYRVINMWFIDQ